ncbi:MAG: nitroreductase [Asgard group archaeon]|nr:nitroreductase [Asgard group archaeon]
MKFEKSIIETISQRVSRRAYEDLEIESDKLQKIKQILKKEFTGPFNGKSRFELIDCGNDDPSKRRKLGTYGFIRGAHYFIIGILKRDEKNIVDFGYSFEKIILKMTELGFGTVWLGSTFRYNQFEECTNLKDNEYIAAITPVGYSKEKPKTYERLISWGISSRKRKPWNKLFYLGDFATALTKNDAEEYSKALEMVRIGPSARNEEPWRVIKEEKSDTFHFYLQLTRKRTADYLPPMKQMDMGIALSHFELTVKEQRIKGKWVKKSPSINTERKNLHYIATWIGK